MLVGRSQELIRLIQWRRDDRYYHRAGCTIFLAPTAVEINELLERIGREKFTKAEIRIDRSVRPFVLVFDPGFKLLNELIKDFVVKRIINP